MEELLAADYADERGLRLSRARRWLCLDWLRIHLRTTLLEFRAQVVDFRIRIRNREFQSRPAGLRELQLRLHPPSFTFELLLARVARDFGPRAAITRSRCLDVLGP